MARLSNYNQSTANQEGIIKLINPIDLKAELITWTINGGLNELRNLVDFFAVISLSCLTTWWWNGAFLIFVLCEFSFWATEIHFVGYIAQHLAAIEAGYCSSQWDSAASSAPIFYGAANLPVPFWNSVLKLGFETAGAQLS